MTTDHDALNVEFEALTPKFNELQRILEWNGSNLLNGPVRSHFQVGANASRRLRLTVGDIYKQWVLAQLEVSLNALVGWSTQ